MTNNPLNIKEKHLLEYYHKLDDLFQLNSLNYEVEYTLEEDPEVNSTLFYSTEINGVVRAGFATYVKKKRKFGGAVFKNKLCDWYSAEGFSEDFIGKEAPLWASTDKLDYFFAMLCIPILKELKFEGENS